MSMRHFHQFEYSESQCRGRDVAFTFHLLVEGMFRKRSIHNSNYEAGCETKTRNRVKKDIDEDRRKREKIVFNENEIVCKSTI